MQLSSSFALFVGGEILELVSSTGAVAKFVLVTLLAFSLISWAIILTKWSLLRRARLQSGRFLRAFRKAQRLQDIATVADQLIRRCHEVSLPDRLWEPEKSGPPRGGPVQLM